MNVSRKGSPRPKPISGVLGKVLSSLGLTANYNGWTILSQWPEIVGKEIADRAEAVSFDEGCLYVAVSDSSWRQQLSMQLEEILEKIHKLPRGNAVKHIRLVHGTKGK